MTRSRARHWTIQVGRGLLERIPSPLTLRGDLGKRRSALRLALDTALTSAFVSTGHRFSVVTSGAQRSKNALLRSP
jgi:hypothetical protein